jgi:LacI family transcriptional regulator
VHQVADRIAGVRQAMAEAGRPETDLTIVDKVGMTIEGGRQAGRAIMDMPRRRRPTAVVCGNDLIALGLLQHALRSDVAVPEELAIVGYDDIEFASAAAVPLTSVRQPSIDLGGPRPSCSSTRWSGQLSIIIARSASIRSWCPASRPPTQAPSRPPL